MAYGAISISSESTSEMLYPWLVAALFEGRCSCSFMACKSLSVAEWQTMYMSNTSPRKLGREAHVDDSMSPDMVSRLRSSGKRITPKRRLLLRIIEQNAHLDAEEIHRIAQKDRPQIGLATVYRTLTLLKDLGIVRATDLGENHDHYEIRSEEHVHLVCSICGCVTDVPVPRALSAVANSEHFAVQSTHLEIFGTCRSCLDKLAVSTKEQRE